MGYIGGMDDDERALLTSTLYHFVVKLNEERSKSADLQRQLDCANERLRLLDVRHYGIV
jgi:hypothetical protein